MSTLPTTQGEPCAPNPQRKRLRTKRNAGKAPVIIKVLSVEESDNEASPKEACKFFLRGNCRFGTGCRNSHEARGKTGTTTQAQQGLRRNTLTRPSQVGTIQASSDNHATNSISANQDAMTGNINNANNGPTASGSSAAASISATSAQKLLQPARRNICFQWRKGNCSRGDKCRYLHEGPLLNTSGTSAAANAAEEAAKAALQAQQEREQQELEAKRRADKAALNEREAAVTSQHTVLKSSIVTYGSGMNVRGIVSGFDTAKVLIHGFPNSASPKDALLLFTQQGLSKDHILLRNIFTKGPGTKSFEALLAKDDAAAVAAGLDGIEFEETTLKFEYSEKALLNDTMKNDEDRKDSIMFSWIPQMLRTATDTNPSPPSDDVVQAIRERLTVLYGVNLVEIKLLSNKDAAKGLAVARFRASNHVQAALIALRNKRLQMDHPIIRAFVPDPFQFSLNIPLAQYRAQKALWDALVIDNSKDGVRMQVTEDGKSERARIRVRGQEMKAIGALKVRVETLAAGEQLDSKHFHQTFARAAGWAFLDTVRTETGAFVRYDFRANALRLYGNANSKEAARQMISEEVTRLESLEWRISLQRQSLGFFIRTGLATLKEMLGEEAVKLDVGSCQLILRGGDNASHALDMLLEQAKDPNALAADAGGEDLCPVCYSPASSPFLLACNHAYCMACLQHYLTSAADTRQFPLMCMGDEAKCDVPIPIPVIRRFLTNQQYNHLVEAVFLTYLEQHPQEFRYCTTPDCEQIYKCNSGKQLKCPSCFSEICSHCDQEGHEGMTCEERTRRRNQEENHFENPVWLAEQGIKCCPSCRSYIQKSEGCNHMTCPCGAHLCWICMVRFEDAGATYTHLRDSHGGYYDEDIRRPHVNQDARLAAALQRQEQQREQQRPLLFGNFHQEPVQARNQVPVAYPDILERRRAELRRAQEQAEAREREARRLAEAQRLARQEADRQAAARRAQMVEYQRRFDERQRLLREQERARRERERQDSGWGCIVM